jgi:hypothetical protein
MRQFGTGRWRRLGCALLSLLLVATSLGADTNQTATASSQPASRPARRRVAFNAPTTQRAANLVPGLPAQQQAQAKIHEIYASDYLDTSFAGRRALARRLIDASEQTKRDMDAKYVLLREARDLATAVGDVTTAFDAIDLLVAHFPVSKLHERVDVLKQSAPTLASERANLAAVSICWDLVDQCIVEGDYDRAEVLLELAADASKRGKSVPYFNWTERRAALIGPVKRAYDLARPFENVLKQNADDPDANLAMGKFVAFVKGDFDAGLSMMAKGVDLKLAKLADEDLETPERASAQFKTAGQWWDLAQAHNGSERDAMRRRAEFWYRKAAPGLDGLDKALAQRRLQDLTPPPSNAKKIERPPDVLMLFPKHWYRDSYADVTWDTAQRLCEESGGRLVCVESRAESDLMKKLANGRTLWLGASVDAEGKWIWLSGKEFFYLNWLSGEASIGGAESHPVITPSGAWKASTGRAGFICEWTE